MSTTRHQRAGIDDRWTRKVKGDDGKIQTLDSPLKGKVTRWRIQWVDDAGREHTKLFDRKPDAQSYLYKLTADVHREYVDPRRALKRSGLWLNSGSPPRRTASPKRWQGIGRCWIQLSCLDGLMFRSNALTTSSIRSGSAACPVDGCQAQLLRDDLSGVAVALSKAIESTALFGARIDR